MWPNQQFSSDLVTFTEEILFKQILQGQVPLDQRYLPKIFLAAKII